jgi:rhodanese-related sulfurtransferase
VGGRSSQATAFLREKGFEAVNLAGGMIDWADAGRPMVGDGDGPPLVV